MSSNSSTGTAVESSHQEHNFEAIGDCKPSSVNENDEIRATEKVINAMFYYRRYGIALIRNYISNFQRLSHEHRSVLSPNFQYHMVKVKECIIHNHKVLQEIVACGVSMLDDEFGLRTAVQISQLRPASDHYMSKVRSTLKQIVRDWTIEGEIERKSCYGVVIASLIQKFPDREMRPEIRILIPGAGLARLAWDLVCQGFTVQGNEFSIFMLLASNFILNKCSEANGHVIYPYVLDTSNNWSYEDQLRPVRFPDCCPVSVTERLNLFSMCAGEFIEATKSDNDCWDVVATIFFIDTAANVLDYVDHIQRILKPGGVWINFGPLTYHFADGGRDGAIELPYETIIQYIKNKGFDFTRDERANKHNFAYYAHNTKSMLSYQYECGFFECMKK